VAEARRHIDLRIATTRFVRFMIGFTSGAPDFGFSVKFFFDPKPANRLDIASPETARVSIAMSMQNA
jgi:hypothetical protein